MSKQSFAKWGDSIRKMPPSKRIRMIREGVIASYLVEASRYFGISQTELSRLLGLSKATIARKVKSGGRFGPMESERLTRIALIRAEAERVFISPDLARRWMLEPNLALGESPLSLLDTEVGGDEVRKVLAVIAYGGTA